MTRQAIEQFLNEYPVTYNSVRVDFINTSCKIGFFENLVGDLDDLKQKNHWRFIEKNNSAKYKENKNNPAKYSTIINGDKVEKLTIL